MDSHSKETKSKIYNNTTFETYYTRGCYCAVPYYTAF